MQKQRTRSKMKPILIFNLQRGINEFSKGFLYQNSAGFSNYLRQVASGFLIIYIPKIWIPTSNKYVYREEKIHLYSQNFYFPHKKNSAEHNPFMTFSGIFSIVWRIFPWWAFKFSAGSSFEVLDVSRHSGDVEGLLACIASRQVTSGFR